MQLKNLDLSSLQKAVKSLEKSLNQWYITQPDEFVRDSCVQRFEYTYELCSKFLRRYLENTEPSADFVEQMSFPTLIRTASERGLLLNDWSIWIQYRDKRNITSHTYDEKKAIAIVQLIPDFLQDAQYLLERIAEKIGS